MFASELAYSATQGELWVGSHILHLDASHGEQSVIACGAAALFAKLSAVSPEINVQHVFLWQTSTRSEMEYNLEHVKAKMAMLAGTAADEHHEQFAGIEVLAKQIATARGLVVSAPMWNFAVPYVVKQYFDCVLHPGLTFRESTSGPVGLLGGGRPLVVLTSSGGAATKDYLTPWLLDVGAMAGFDRPKVVSAASLVSRDRETVKEAFRQQAEAAAAHLSLCQFDRSAYKPESHELSASCGHEELRSWLESSGGLSLDCLDCLEAAHVNGELFLAAGDADWRDEELGLEEADIARLQELQKLFLELVRQHDE
ncbi:azoR1 [Symbiodinium pilosum]|uniref:AzoR1 protein n=1 Tax=Symbiodinium pilosum TaxID=2952 RepID=A0A812JHE8_SYMPI|nr:azoR1 [Symbiodinium pilosum]